MVVLVLLNPVLALIRPLPMAQSMHRVALVVPTTRLQASLDAEEVRALAGLWRADLDLDDAQRSLTCNLDVSGKCSFVVGDGAPIVGTVAGAPRWEAYTVLADKSVCMNLCVGPWVLQGCGERDGLRCSVVRGSVLEGAEDDQVCVGRFEMALSVPVASESELPALEARHLARLASRPAPPVRFSRASFVGRWRLLLTFQSESPRMLEVELNSDARTFRSAGAPAGTPALGGTWGLWDRSNPKEKSALAASGTHFFLRVERDRSDATLRGIGDLPVFESFSLWGTPGLGSPEAELAARTQAGGTSSDQIDGSIYFGTSADREWVVAGAFSLIRRGLS